MSPVPITIPPLLFCKIHQYLCTLSRLAVFVGDIMTVDILTDILKMDIHRLAIGTSIRVAPTFFDISQAF